MTDQIKIIAGMDITRIGHSSFKIRSKSATVVTDPFNEEKVGIKFPKIEADIVTVSHEHDDHSYVEGIVGKPILISGPGEYEVKNVKIRGISTFHDSKRGKERGKNTIYRIDIDKLSILHCGDLGHKLDDNIVDLLGEINILMIPVGGVYTIDANQAIAVVSNVEPNIVIPMHYNYDMLNQKVFDKIAGVDEFLKEIDKESVRQKKLSILKKTLPEETMIVVLE